MARRPGREDDFETALKSGQTRKLQQMDETKLGYTTPPRGGSLHGSAQTSPASPVTHMQGHSNSGGRPLPEPGSDLTKRRSVYRGVGTASSQTDLATLLRNAKAKASAAPASESGTDPSPSLSQGQFSESDAATLASPDLEPAAFDPNVGPVPPPRRSSNARSVSPPRAKLQTARRSSHSRPSGRESFEREARSRETTAGSSNTDSSASMVTHAPTSRLTSGRVAKGISPSFATTDSIATDSQTESYVVVPSTSSRPFDSPPRKGRPSQNLDSGSETGSGIGYSHQDNNNKAQDKSFSNTMRKTSGFFRRKFGANTATARYNPSSFHTANTSSVPISRLFDEPNNTLPPPVPVVPASYMRDKALPPVDTEAPSLPVKEPNLSISNISPMQSSAPTLSPNLGHTRKRSSSFSSVHTANRPPSFLGIPENQADASRSRRTSMQSSASFRLSEDDRLKNVLGSMDWDSVMEVGQQQERARKLERQERPQAVRSGSAPSPRPQLLNVFDDPANQQSTALSSPKAHSSMPPPIAMPAETRSSLNSAGISTPDIRVDGSPSMQRRASDPSPIVPVSGRTDDGHGLGLNLATIRESGHSRENSLNAAHQTPAGSSAIPTFVTQSPSPSQKRSDSHDSLSPSIASAMQTPTRPNARQSVVGLPDTGNQSLLNLLSLSQSGQYNNSSVSLLRGTSRGAEMSSEDELHAPVSGKRPIKDDRSVDEKASEAAERCWEGDEKFLRRQKVAEYLGSNGKVHKIALRLYMERFDFRGFRLDAAFRHLCEKLYLKAETQQVDRILERFSRKYFRDNPDHVFGSSDVVHAITYSLLLLNTDLHVAELSSRMSQKQFVRNTMSAIHMQFGEILAKTNSRASSHGAAPPLPTGRNRSGSFKETYTPDEKPSFYQDPKGSASRVSLDRWREGITRMKRSGSASDGNPLEQPAFNASVNSLSTPGKDGSTTPKDVKGWDQEVEGLLKEMYNAIKMMPVYQPSDSPAGASRTSTNLSAASSPYGTWSGMGRNPSRRSQVSFNHSDSTNKRASIRTFLNPSGDLARATSPTPSVATSFSEHHSFSTAYGTNVTTPSSHGNSTIGFASNLSHTIIKEQQEDDDAQSDSEASIADEELALLGAPWAKEGILHRKHYWESNNKRSKDKQWLQAFVVISKGELKMFKFGESGRGHFGGHSGLGGGNWMTNAKPIGEMSLLHSLCSAMPPPGYSSDRPHIFVLTLSSGSSYFFQAGTADLVHEWEMTCNYWAARLSKEPLTGGVSNMEYGWNRVQPREDPDEDVEDLVSVKSGKSGRSGRYSSSSGFYGGSNSNDRIHINEWKSAASPTTTSVLSEEAQLDALRRYVRSIQSELSQHNSLRSAMNRLYTPRSTNAQKATANWERKSKWLLAEIVKYTTYIQALDQAIQLRQRKGSERSMARLLAVADEAEDEEDFDYGDLEDLSSTRARDDRTPSPIDYRHRTHSAPESPDTLILPNTRYERPRLGSQQSSARSHDTFYDADA